MQDLPVIRPIRIDDAQAFRDAVAYVRAERRYILPGPPSPIEKAQSFIEDNLANGYPQYVVDSGDGIGGWCDITRPSDNEAIRHVGQLGMALLPEFRGRGIGERLILATLAASDDFGFSRVQLGVFATNARARSLYRKVGFTEEGVRRGYVLIDGVLIDEILMARHLISSKHSAGGAEQPPQPERPIHRS